MELVSLAKLLKIRKLVSLVKVKDLLVEVKREKTLGLVILVKI